MLDDKSGYPEIWVVGGSNPSVEGDIGTSVEVYSTVWDEWRVEKSLKYSRSDHGAAPVNGTLYVGGGLASCGSETCLTSTVESYTPSTASWTAGPALLSARRGLFFASDETNGLLYAVGGVSCNSDCSTINYLDTFEVLNVNTGVWSTLPSMPTPRTALSAAVLDGKVYAVGGCGGQNNDLSKCEPLSVIEVYDPVAQSWTNLSPLKSPRHSFTLGLYGTQLIVAGGSSSVGLATGTSLTRSVDTYDIIGNEWYNIAFMPDPREGLVRGYSLFVGISMFLISGESSSTTYSNTNELMALMCYKNVENGKGKFEFPLCPE
jgi:N-acetylneuraminic acid mutarotase